MRLLLPLIALYLSTCSPVYAGYESVILPQIPQFVTVEGQNGTENWPNPAAHMLPVGVFCKPANFARHAADPVQRTVIVRSNVGTLTTAEVLAVCPTVLNEKYQRLWEAASKWEQKNISGVALSLLTLGVAKGTPKAMAIAAWSNTLWNTTYYPRKALISLDSEPDCNFSIVGDMPYSVPELSAEVWGQ